MCVCKNPAVRERETVLEQCRRDDSFEFFCQCMVVRQGGLSLVGAFVVGVEKGSDQPVDVLGDGVETVATVTVFDGLVKSIAGQPVLHRRRLFFVRPDKVGYQQPVKVDNVDHDCKNNKGAKKFPPFC